MNTNFFELPGLKENKLIMQNRMTVVATNCTAALIKPAKTSNLPNPPWCSKIEISPAFILIFDAGQNCQLHLLSCTSTLNLHEILV
jgi:hypothetical protein